MSFVIPTRNRFCELEHTLGELSRLDINDLGGVAEIVIVENGSNDLDLPSKLQNGIMVSVISLDENIGAGARNIGAQRATGQWVMMLDDDSNLLPGRVCDFLSGLDADVGAVGGEIFLADGSHEAGGLPEVVVGCGCVFRRALFNAVGGYDTSFGYYAEEYDLCAKLIADGHRVLHTREIRFEHRKSSVGRDMNEILYRLVRNNGWVIQRYAPDSMLEAAHDEMVARYRHIAGKEQALSGFRRGLSELKDSVKRQTRSPMGMSQWKRFIGVEAMEQWLGGELDASGCAAVSIVGEPWGKGLEQIEAFVADRGIEVVDGESLPGVSIVGTLSPGPMLDAKLAYPDAICPWELVSSATRVQL